nr:Hint domain-containing protein [Rhodovulum tesquicola]
MLSGVTYNVLSISSNTPTIAYTGLYVCFAAGTHLLTAAGEVPVETLRPGCRLVTADHGLQPLRWILGRRVQAQGPAAPVIFDPEGQSGRPLAVSQQHRMAVDSAGQEVLVAAKAFLGQPGVRLRSGGAVRY